MTSQPSSPPTPIRSPGVRLRRERVEDRLAGALDRRLVRVVAGAGYGKTGLVIAAAERSGLTPVLVPAVGPGPAGTLAARIARSLDRHAPGLGAAAAGAPTPEAGLATLLEEAGRRDLEAFVLVLDDVHALLGTPAEAELGRLVRDLPPVLRLVLAGRADLSDDLHAARPDAADLGEDALALAPEEARELLTLVGAAEGGERADALIESAEGWVTGLLLAAQGGDPLGFLQQEVLAHEPSGAVELLEATSGLEHFTPEMAVRVSGSADAAGELAGLVARHAFVRSAGDDPEGLWHRQHPMMAALTRRRMAARPGAERAVLHRRAAAAWISVGRPERAARHYLGAGDVAGALSMLAPVARSLTDEERRGMVAACLDAVPPELWSDTSGVVLAQASTLFYRADWTGAFDAMEQAVERLLDRGDHDRAAATLIRLLRAVPLAGALHERAIEAAGRLVPRIEGSSEMLPAAQVILALLLADLARYDEAEEQLDQVLASRGGSSSPEALQASVTRAFAIDHRLGRSVEALAVLDAAIPALDAAGPADRLHYLLYTRAFRAMVLSDLGRFAEALEEAERLSDAAAARGFARLAAAVASMLRFGALAGLERWDELEAELGRAAPLFRRLGGVLRGYGFDVARAQLSAARGDVPATGAAIADAREGLAAHGRPYDAAMVLADLAAVAGAVGSAGLEGELAEAAEREAARAQAPWAAVRASMRAAAALGESTEGDVALASALAASGVPAMTPLWTRRERRLAAVLLPRALARRTEGWPTGADLAAACGGEVLRSCVAAAAGAGPEVATELARAARDAGATEPALARLRAEPGDGGPARASGAGRRSAARPGITLRTLGRFAVERGGESVTEADFGRRKARMLLAMLACARRAVHRETLAYALWPDLTVGRGIANLNSTLSSLRRALQPDLSAGESSSLVVAEGASYRLVLGEGDRWDAGELLDAADAALASSTPAALEAVAAAYRGPLLPEWIYAPWTEPLRTQVEEAHRAVLVRAAEVAAAEGRHEEAIRRYRTLLAMEPEREGWHRALMRVYAGAGERALALRHFEECRRILKEGLGVEPSRATRDLHAALLRGDRGGWPTWPRGGS